MSPDTDEYWVGSFAVACAMIHNWLLYGRSDLALLVLEDLLERFGNSPLLENDPDLRQQVAEYWPPREEKEDDRDVLRSLRPGNPS
jgi:hypothetical protein